jgi:hypothetical protein
LSAEELNRSKVGERQGKEQELLAKKRREKVRVLGINYIFSNFWSMQ